MSPVWKFPRAVIAITVALATMATAAACTKRSDAGSTTASAGKHFSVIVVSGPLDDPFFGAIKRGADNAAKELNINVDYLSPASSKEGSGPTLARLIQDAINKKPDALIVGDFFPDAEDPVIKQAVKAGIPVILQNTGDTRWQDDGALSYVGVEPKTVGSQAATEMTAEGVRNVLCVNPVPGNPTTEAVCRGLKENLAGHGGTSTELTIPYGDATDPTKVTQDIAGALRTAPSITGVFVFGSSVAENARRAATQAGRTVTIGAGDLSTQLLKDIQAGNIAFALDQQPYLQSYYPILMAQQYLQYGVMPGPVSTGPQIINKQNAAKVLATNKQTNGVRGAA